MATKEKTPYECLKDNFSASTSLSEAKEIVWTRKSAKEDGGSRGMFQHYTTLNRVLEKIITRRWYLTRCDSKKLNDLQEAKKYGRSRNELVRRTYIMCLSNGAGENVAMWGLYGHNDPFAMRVSIPRQTIEKWMHELLDEKGCDIRDKQCHKINWSRIEIGIGQPAFHDMIYVAVQDKDIVDEFDIRRTNSISWEEATCSLDKGYDLNHEIRREEYAGWLKDYEWHHERESRLCIRLRKNTNDEAISIAIPGYVIENMRFTFSPWLNDETVRKSIQATVEAALKSSGEKNKPRFQRFRRSVLQGSLNFPS